MGPLGERYFHVEQPFACVPVISPECVHLLSLHPSLMNALFLLPGPSSSFLLSLIPTAHIQMEEDN